MHARRDDPSIPAWSQDLLESPLPPEIEAPYFDDALDAWVLSRHADILAAFRASALLNSASSTDADRIKMRAEIGEALSPDRLSVWRSQLAYEAHSLANRLPTSKPVDLMDAYARPLCLSLAAAVTGISQETAQRLIEPARRVSAASAEPRDSALKDRAKSANAELRGCFHSGPEGLRDSGFVALSQTLPSLLGNSWFALIQRPEQWDLLHRQPGLVEQALEELLRYAGLARILSRTATADIELNGASIRQGERVFLRVVAANRDPDRFNHPNQVDFTRRDAGHLTLGAGPHSCVAAGLIRMASLAITTPLVQRFGAANPTQPVEWLGGSVFRSPKSLWVSLSVSPFVEPVGREL
jgi:cytochrome P450